MRNIKGRVLKHAKRIKHFIQPLKMPEKYLRADVPYFSQWESRELNKQIFEGTISTDDDPLWKKSGAQTKEEYHQWSWSGCGVACTKMILADQNGQIVPLVELGKKCAEYGGYKPPRLRETPGLYYKPYVQFVAQEFGWKAKIVQGASLNELMHELGKNNYVIAGVSPHIHDPHARPKVKGGHLILLLGYDKAKRKVYFHNPSGTSRHTQEYAAVSFDDFMKFFSGRGIVVEAR